MNLSQIIKNIVHSKNEEKPPGIFSICSANPLILTTCIKESAKQHFPLLIESTCNQVNQFGGYTGMKPKDFYDYTKQLAVQFNFPQEIIFFGGDHLGPSVWRAEPSASAMEKSIMLIRQYIGAGYKKIHLDASMPCSDDDVPLPDEIIAKREAILCTEAVETCTKLGLDSSELVFIVGSEVPTPGGAVKNETDIDVSSVEDTRRSIEQTRQVFYDHGLQIAWQQTHAFVVQPGVEFGDETIHHYNPAKARNLSLLIEEYDNLVFEAHSTDYQTKYNLEKMVVDHFAILKVGPALTFALREAVYALEAIEKILTKTEDYQLSEFQKNLDKVMCAQPEYWKNHYSSNEYQAALQRKYSFLDRSRYYWNNPLVNNSFDCLIKNLAQTTIPLTLISQYLPNQSQKLKAGLINNSPLELIQGKIADVLSDYRFACGKNYLGK